MQSQPFSFGSSMTEIEARYADGMVAMRHGFERTGNGRDALRRRTALVDEAVTALWQNFAAPTDAAPEIAGVALVATGGFGRSELFPASDVDLLFLCADRRTEAAQKENVRATGQALWDLGMRGGVTARTLDECGGFDATNVEFTLSLLDSRLVIGDTALFARLCAETLTDLALRDGRAIAAALAELTRGRYARFGNTVFHLEPNVKDAPGALRDIHVSRWLARLTATGEGKREPAPNTGGVEADNGFLADAFEFLAATRCFLHLRARRDDNILSWSAQDEAAAESIGLETAGTADPAYWMRTYYRHARAVSRQLASALSAAAPATRPSLLRGLRPRRALPLGPKGSAHSNFVLREGQIDLPDGGVLEDGEAVLALFGAMAEHGSPLSRRAEAAVESALPLLDLQLPEGPYLWNALRTVLLGPHAALALRAMHALGVLELLLPEFHGIDALVIRDAYHRYTVDEHTFLAIESIGTLRDSTLSAERPFAALLPELSRLDLLLLALLLHDTGKARRSGDHTAASVELARSAVGRLELDEEEAELVLWLITEHLEMSAALRRDIFDLEVVRAFAERAGSPSRLKLLCLLTFADIRAVSPEALTPWKAENLWQLFISASNYLDRSVDADRVHGEREGAVLRRLLAGRSPGREEALRRFLDGVPQRYLQTRSPDEIWAALALAYDVANAASGSPAGVAIRPRRQLFELTLVTLDRPALFADVAGALSAWGMDIVKAEAFSNSGGMAIDSFSFTDPFGTLSLNPGEADRLRAEVAEVARGSLPVGALLARRSGVRSTPARREIATTLSFDPSASSHSTVLEVVAQDGPGLLRALALTLSSCGCDIRVALVDTEGEMAIDVFYITLGGDKLDTAVQDQVAEALQAAVAELAGSTRATAAPR